jgi:hypothetical protein
MRCPGLTITGEPKDLWAVELKALLDALAEARPGNFDALAACRGLDALAVRFGEPEAMSAPDVLEMAGAMARLRESITWRPVPN